MTGCKILQWSKLTFNTLHMLSVIVINCRDWMFYILQTSHLHCLVRAKVVWVAIVWRLIVCFSWNILASQCSEWRRLESKQCLQLTMSPNRASCITSWRIEIPQKSDGAFLALKIICYFEILDQKLSVKMSGISTFWLNRSDTCRAL